MLKGVLSQISININEKTISYLPAGKGSKRETYEFKRNHVPEHMFEHLTPEEVFLGSLLTNLTHRELFLNKTASAKYRYPVAVMKEDARKKYGNFGGYGELYYGLLKKETTQVKVMELQKGVQKFKETIQEKDKKISKVIRNDDAYVTRVYNGEVRYAYVDKSEALVFKSYKELYLVLKGMAALRDVKLENV